MHVMVNGNISEKWLERAVKIDAERINQRYILNEKKILLSLINNETNSSFKKITDLDIW